MSNNQKYKFKAKATLDGRYVEGYYFYDEARNDGTHIFISQDIPGNLRETKVDPNTVELIGSEQNKTFFGMDKDTFILILGIMLLINAVSRIMGI